MPAIAETLHSANTQVSRVVLFSDRREALAGCVNRMASAGFDVTVMGFAADGLELLRQHKPPLAVVDLSLPGTAGLDMLEAIRKEKLGIVVIAVSHDGSLKRAVEAMKLGAFDYLPEPFDSDRLILAMHAALGREVPAPAGKATADAIEALESYLGLSPEMREVCHAIETAGAAAGHVLIAGAAGLGRDVCARAIHASSRRRHQPFVTLNCAAIPDSLLASELFGHVADAFPGAVVDRAGLATEAHGGTLFLDEICALDAVVQERVLQLATHGTFQRLGGVRLEQVDIRIIGATSLDPAAAVTDGRLDEALFESVGASEIALPPGRRDGEIMRIAKLFLFGKAADAGTPAATPMPDAAPGRAGDIRDLQKALQDAMATSSGRLPEPAGGGPGTAASQPQKRSGSNG